MISAWWLLLIVPVVFITGYVAGAVVMVLKIFGEGDRE